MLEQGRIYQTADYPRREFEVVSEIGAGVVARVYKLRDKQSNQFVVAKVPKTNNDFQPLRAEADILQNLERNFTARKYPRDVIPVPLDVEIMQLENPGGSPILALLMEFIPENDPEMFTSYRDRLRAAPRDRIGMFKVEKFAWKLALLYLDVLDVSIRELKKYTGDRKRDTFRWDAEHSRLIVMDWNQFTEVRNGVEAEGNALTSLAQNWFTMLTQRQATLYPPSWLADKEWADISLYGRQLIIRMLGRTGQQLSLVQAQSLVRDLLNPGDLEQRLNEALQDWKAQLANGKLKPDELENQDQNRDRSVLVTADLVWRVSDDEGLRDRAKKLYDEVRATFEKSGEKPDFSNWESMSFEPTLRALEESNLRWFNQSLDELLRLLRENQNAARKSPRLVSAANALMNTLQTMPRDVGQWRQKVGEIRERFEILSRQFYSVAGKEIGDKLGEITSQITLYDEILNFYEDLRRTNIEEPDGARARFETQIRPLIAQTDRLKALGLTVEQLTQSLQDQGRRSIVDDWRKLFASACGANTLQEKRQKLDEFITRLTVAQSSPITSMGEQAALSAYKDAALTLTDAFRPFLGNDSARFNALKTLIPILKQFPEATAVVRDLPLYRDSVNQYRTRVAERYAMNSRKGDATLSPVFELAFAEILADLVNLMQ